MTAPSILVNVPWRWLGRVPFADAVAANEADASARRRCVLMFEPAAPVLTLGRRANGAAGRAELAPTIAACEQRGIAVIGADRGGLATLHLPGQLVLFVSLPPPLPPVRTLVAELLGAAARVAIARTPRPDDVRVDVCDDVGVYVPAGKRACAGVRVRDRVVQHGVSLNVAIDPAPAIGLSLCGSSTRGFASLTPPGTDIRPIAEDLARALELART